MASDSLLRVQVDGAEITFMLGAEDGVEVVENVDSEVVLKGGSRWTATLVSLDEINRIMDRWRVAGECGSGSYFHCSDLVIVRERGIHAMVKVLKGIIDSGQLENVLVKADRAD